MAINSGFSALAEDAHPIKPYHDVLRKHGYAPAQKFDLEGSDHYGEGKGIRQNTYVKKEGFVGPKASKASERQEEGKYHPSMGHEISIHHDRNSGEVKAEVRRYNEYLPQHEAKSPSELEHHIKTSNKEMTGHGTENKSHRPVRIIE